MHDGARLEQITEAVKRNSDIMRGFFYKVHTL